MSQHSTSVGQPIPDPSKSRKTPLCSFIRFTSGFSRIPPDTYVCVSGGKKCSFFVKFGVLCLLETPILRFAPLPYY